MLQRPEKRQEGGLHSRCLVSNARSACDLVILLVFLLTISPRNCWKWANASSWAASRFGWRRDVVLPWVSLGFMDSAQTAG